MREVYEKAFKLLPGEQIAETIRKHRGSASVYQSLDQTLSHPQAQALGLLQEIERENRKDRHRNYPARFSRTTIKKLAQAPGLGEHTNAIAAELGLSTASASDLLK